MSLSRVAWLSFAVLLAPVLAAQAQVFSTPKNISNTASASLNPQVAEDTNGNINVLWQERTGIDHQDIFYARSTDGGTTFSVPKNISNNSLTSVNPQVALDTDGGVYVVWEQTTSPDGESREIFFTRSLDGGVTFSSPANISNTAATAVKPRIAVAQGYPYVFVVWEKSSGVDSGEVFLTLSIDKGTSFSMAKNISTTATPSLNPDVAVHGTDDVDIVWEEAVEADDHDIFFRRVGDLGTLFLTRINIFRHAGPSANPHVAADSCGDIYVTWQQEVGIDNREVFFTRSLSSGWSFLGAENISNSASPSLSPHIAADANCNVDVVWEEGTGIDNRDVFFARSVDQGADFSTPANISNTEADSRSPQVATDPLGNIDVVWQESVGSDNSDIFFSRGVPAPVPGVVLGASSVNFGDQLVGTSSAPQTISVTNSGQGSLIVSSVSISGTDSGDFPESDNCVGPVDAGASCSISVTFTPSAVGTRSATLTITDNAEGSPRSVPLTGTGIQQTITLSPSSLSFSAQPLGTASSPQTTTLTNNGTSTLNITGITVTGSAGADFSQTNTCGTMVAPGASCAISVTFTSQALGFRSALLTVADDGLGSPRKVPLSGVGVTSMGNVIQVPGDVSTIQGAIDQANHDDVVLVAPGTYTENIDFKGKAITVMSENGPAATVIDGNSADSVVKFDSSETAASVLSGFTIQHGLGTYSGGGIYISNSSPMIFNNLISNNKACDGAGIDIHFASPVVQGNIISNNSRISCSGGIGGGGIEIGGAASAQVLDNTISNNATTADGGGIALFAAGTPVIRGNTITGNTSSSHGGGISMFTFSDALVVQNVIRGNKSGAGGGIYWSYGGRGPRLVSNTITGNYASQGSAIYASGFGEGTVVVNNILIGRAGQVAMFCDDTGDIYAQGFTSNDVYSPQAAAYGGICTDQTGRNGNISADPLFVDPTNANLRLQAGSPAIDAGFNAAENLPKHDIAGNARIVDGNGDCTAVVDMGAYEFFRASQLTYSPTSLTFPDQLVGTGSEPQAVTVTNMGDSATSFCSIATTGDFAQTAHTCTGSLASKASCSIQVTFTPTAQGTRSGELRIDASDTAGTQSIALSGKGVLPLVEFSSASVAFGNQQTGTTSDPKTVTLSNTGDGALTIQKIEVTGTHSGDFQESDNCSGSIAAGSSCSISITFAPTAAGDRSATIEITDNAADSPQTVALTGTGTAPVVTLGTTSVSFAEQRVGTTSSAQNVTLSNSGTAILSITGIAITGAQSGDFLQSNTCGVTINMVLRLQVATGSNCTISITFAPTATGVRNATLEINDNAEGSPHTVALSGTGTAPAATLGSASLSFAEQRVGTTSSAQTVKLTNGGTAALSIASIAMTGTHAHDFKQSNTCGSSIAAGTNCTISITFAPTGTGARSATLEISDDAEGSPHTVTLSGTGIAPAVTLESASVSFAEQRVGTASSAQTVSLTNSGTAPLSITGIEITGTHSADFKQSNTCDGSVAAGANCSISVTFTPTAAGGRTASLVITDDAPGSPHSLTLTGTGTAPGVALSPASVTFSGQLVTTVSTTQTVKLTNTGNAPLDITSITISGTNADDFSQTNTCGTSVDTGASCTINVTFRPASAGNRTATIVITDSAAGSPRSITLTGQGTDFSLAAASGGSTSVTVNAGQTATYNLQLAPTNDFSGSVALACSGAPSLASCSVSPTSVSVSGAAAAFTVTVTTTAPSLVAPQTGAPPVGFKLGLPLLAALGALLLLLAGFAATRKQRKPSLVPIVGLACVLLIAAWSAACGGGGPSTPTNPGTPAGTYSLTVTGTSAGVSHATTLNLTVK